MKYISLTLSLLGLFVFRSGISFAATVNSKKVVPRNVTITSAGCVRSLEKLPAKFLIEMKARRDTALAKARSLGADKARQQAKKKAEETYTAEMNDVGKMLEYIKVICKRPLISLPDDYILAATSEQPFGLVVAAALQRRIDAVGEPLVPGFIRYLNTNNKAEAVAAAKQLIRIGSPRAAMAVLDKIETVTDDALNRHLLLQNLNDVWLNPRAADVLVKRLLQTKQQDLAYELRENILHQIEGPELVHALRNALEAAPKFNDELDVAGYPRDDAMEQTMDVLSRITAPQAIGELVRTCHLSSSTQARVAAALGLVNIWTKQSVAAFHQCVIPQEWKKREFISGQKSTPREGAGEIRSIMFGVNRGVDDEETMDISYKAIRFTERIPGRPGQIETRKISFSQFRELERLITKNIPTGYQYHYDYYAEQDLPSSKARYSLTVEKYGRGIRSVGCFQCSREFNTVRKKIEMFWAAALPGVLEAPSIQP